MSKRYAVRTIRLCTKDCLCLYVCPTGASDTENSVIDVEKCIGCGVCADACPSGAISMVPTELPPQQPKSDAVKNALFALLKSKCAQEAAAAGLDGRLAAAIEKSNRIMAEDIAREAGYMLPQSANAHKLLSDMLEQPQPTGFPREAAEKLLERIQPNEPLDAAPAEIWKCGVCGHLHEGPLPDGFACPVCNAPAAVFDRLE